ncbi:MAG: hypothetical protein H7Y31_05340 [Chitinophagaceae bacterium]|nr:hypothetical protein [Chitinophagaceae bacterium]
MDASSQGSYSKGRAFWLFFTIAVLAFLLMSFWGDGLSSSSIIDFEIAKTPERAKELMATWTSHYREQLLKAIYIDFVFIIGYAGTLFYTSRIMGHASAHPILKKAGDIFSFGAIAAGICDILENFGMLFTIRQKVIGWIVHFTYDMALVKFSLLFIVLMFVVIAGVSWIFKKR